MTYGTYQDLEKFVWELEALLKANGIEIKNHGAFEEAALSLAEMDYMRQNPTGYDCTVDSREKWRRALSLADFAEKICLVRNHPDFSQLVPHLGLLGGESDISQFSATKPQNQDNNKVFELYVAAMGLPILTDISVDNPIQSKGDNPDLMGTFKGKRWAIACKAMHTTNPKTTCERIEEGIAQIELSSAECGFVMVNMKNAIDHNALWPAEIRNGEYHYREFPTVADALRLFQSEYHNFQAGVFGHFGSELQFHRHLFKGKKAAPYVLLVFSSVVGLKGPTGPIFTVLKTILCLCIGKDVEAEDFANRLNMGLHNRPDDPLVLGVDQVD